jgi:mono/diheme cytochrome c family protein
MERRATMLSLLVFVVAMALAATAGAQEVTYTKDIKPLWSARCAVCHGAESPELGVFEKAKDEWMAKMKGPRMDSYANLISFVGWPDTGAIMRRLDDGKGTPDMKPGNMYMFLGGTDEERQKNLGLFRAWVGNWTLKRWKDVTKEDLAKIKVEY